jgi:putative hydrolase of the HAD superfamily
VDWRGAVLFDAAGTLIELREPVGDTYSRIARDYGVDLPSRRISDAFHRVFAHAPAMVFPNASIREIPALERAWWRQTVRTTFLAADPATRFRDFEAFFDTLFRVMGQPDAWREAPGARDLLVELRSRRWATGIVSNFDRRLIAILASLYLAPLFDAVVLASDAGAAKPDPAIFHRALEQLGVSHCNGVVVGDDPVQDLAGARNAGLRAIDVTSLAKLGDLADLLESAISGPGNVAGGGVR